MGRHAKDERKRDPAGGGGGGGASGVTVLLVCGLPGSGKSTFSNQLAAGGWARVNQDEMGTAAACQKAMEKALKHRRSVVVDRCCVTPSDRKMWVRAARAAECKDAKTGAPVAVGVEVVFLNTPPEECKRRVRVRKDHPTLGPDQADVIDEFCRGFKLPEKWEGPYDACFVAAPGTADRLLPRYADPKCLAAAIVPDLTAAAAPPAAPSPRGKSPPAKPGDVAGSTKGCGIYLIRHGERTDRVDGAHVPVPDDCDITKEGRRQARCAGEFIAGHAAAAGAPVTAVYSSPFIRCVQTAAEAAAYLGVSYVRIEPGLAELCSGRIFKHGRPVLNKPAAALKYLAEQGLGVDASVPPVAAQLPDFPESGSKANARIRATVAALAQRHPNEHVALFTHSHGLVDATQSLPTNARSIAINPRPGYCGLTYIAPDGRAALATDLVYRSRVSGAWCAGAEPGPAPPAAGRWADGWVWDGAAAAAAVEGEGGDKDEDEDEDLMAAASAAAPSSVVVDAAIDEDAAVEQVLAADLDGLLAAYPKFDRFFRKGSPEQQAKFRADWAKDGPVKHLKIRQKVLQGVRTGWFATPAAAAAPSPPPSPGLAADGADGAAGDALRVVSIDASDIDDDLERAAAAAAADVICVHNVTPQDYQTSYAKGAFFGDAAAAEGYACSAEATTLHLAALGAPGAPPPPPLFGIVHARKALCPTFQTSLLAGGSGDAAATAVFATVHARGAAAVVGCAAPSTAAHLQRAVDLLAAGRTGEGDAAVAVLATAGVPEGAGAALEGYTAVGAGVYATAAGKPGEVPWPEAGEALHAVPTKFPRTQHAYAAGGVGFDDLVLPPADVAAMFHTGAVTVEEKVDGSNLGVYYDEGGRVVCQNRGKVVTSASGTQWGRLDAFLEAHRGELYELLGRDFILYGEWMVARHSIHYTRLPGYFVAFDLYHRPTRRFLSVAQRDARLAATSLPVVPPLRRAARLPDKAAVMALLKSRSHFTDAAVEGVYLRRDTEDGMWLQHRAKVVNAEFIQGIDEHWQKRTMEKNILAF